MARVLRKQEVDDAVKRLCEIMNREWRDEGEIVLETEEEQAVRESVQRASA
jgi:hypothetical protein